MALLCLRWRNGEDGRNTNPANSAYGPLSLQPAEFTILLDPGRRTSRRSRVSRDLIERQDALCRLRDPDGGSPRARRRRRTRGRQCVVSPTWGKPASDGRSQRHLSREQSHRYYLLDGQLGQDLRDDRGARPSLHGAAVVSTLVGPTARAARPAARPAVASADGPSPTLRSLS